MAQYVFTAANRNTDLFCGKFTRFSLNTSDPFSEMQYLATSSHMYIGRYKSEFYTCGAYFGVDSQSKALLDHIRELPSGQIASIKLSFDYYAGNHGSGFGMYWDTAENSNGQNFASNHKKAGLKNTQLPETSTSHADIDVTEYGIPSSYGWLFRYNKENDAWITSNPTLTVETNESYTLSISAGTGSYIEVRRTSSPTGASIGELSDGASIYHGDVLKIIFMVNSCYSLTTHTVNGSTFESYGEHTVAGNVSVASTATPLMSKIGATDANIGSASAITITRYNNSFTHTVTYLCTVGSDIVSGTVVTKGTNTSISWTVPTSIYALIPNAKTATVRLICETFSGNTSIGNPTSTTITVTAAAANCTPTVNGAVVDTNPTTVALTGNSSNLIRYKSNAQCTITATAKNSADISSKKINGAAPTSGDVTTYNGVSATSFTFSATDTRGYSATQTKTPTMIAYVPLTCNPTVYWSGADSIAMDVHGNYFRGSFGAYNNTLSLKYRFKQSSASTYGSWQSVTGIGGGNNTYSKSDIAITGTFDYTKAYDFQIQVQDGANLTTNQPIILTTVTKSIQLSKRTPIFDWGENDLSVNVPVELTSRRVPATSLSTSGWYRLLSVSSIGGGAYAFAIDFFIGRTHTAATNEQHKITLAVNSNSYGFMGEMSKSSTNVISAIRYTTDGSGNGYVDIQYSSNYANSVYADFAVHCAPEQQVNFAPQSLQSVADPPSGETVRASYSFTANTIDDESAVKDSNFDSSTFNLWAYRRGDTIIIRYNINVPALTEATEYNMASFSRIKPPFNLYQTVAGQNGANYFIAFNSSGTATIYSTSATSAQFVRGSATVPAFL